MLGKRFTIVLRNSDSKNCFAGILIYELFLVIENNLQNGSKLLMPDQIELIVSYYGTYCDSKLSVELNEVVKLIVICLTCQGLVVTSL